MKESNLIEFKERFVSDLNKEVIDLINKKGEIIRSDNENLLNISSATATRILTKMVESGQINLSGSARSIKYFL